MIWEKAFETHNRLAALWKKWHSHEKFEHWTATFLREKAGWEVLTSGWPDLLLVSPEGKIYTIEVKQGSDTVKPNQKRVHEILRKAGIPTVVLRSRTSLSRFLEENPQFNRIKEDKNA